MCQGVRVQTQRRSGQLAEAIVLMIWGIKIAEAGFLLSEQYSGPRYIQYLRQLEVLNLLVRAYRCS